MAQQTPPPDEAAPGVPPELLEVVDTTTARELLKEATKYASSEDLERTGALLEQKVEIFRGLLGPVQIETLDADGFDRLCRMMFSVRRRGKALVRAHGIEKVREEVRGLLYGEGPIGARLDAFLAGLPGFSERRMRSLASELLHFTDPERNWLWCQWIWDPETNSGALRMLGDAGMDLTGDSAGAVYEKIGHATAMVTADGLAAGYTRLGRGLLGTDVFLACTHAIYMYTVYRLKISQEFNRFLPELPDLTRRMLGVKQLAQQTAERRK